VLDDSLLWNAEPAPPRKPTPGEPLFEFVRAFDGAFMSAELRFHRESFGWEVEILERGEILYARDGFVLRELAVKWSARGTVMR
jgi:hypothetical protein